MDHVATEEQDWESGQKRLAGFVADWRSSAVAAPVFTALERFARGGAIGHCPPLASLFGADGRLASDFIEDFTEGALAALADHPRGQLPLRHACRRASQTVLLARAAGTSLGVTVYDGGSLAMQPEPRSVEFAPVETWVRVLAGNGAGERVTRGFAPSRRLRRTELALRPGVVVERDGRKEAFRVKSAESSLVVLRLQRALPVADAVDEVRLDDGVLLHQAAVRAEDSRLELAIAVLVAQERRDAVPGLARIASGAAPTALRWSALRAVLSLDTRAGMMLLGELAGDEDEMLGPAARGLQRDLIRKWPELEKVAQWRG